MNKDLKQNDLFDLQLSSGNLLPFDGTVIYHGLILTNEQANQCLSALSQDIVWKHDEAIIYGKKITTRRKVAWYGDKAYQYTYSKTTKQALPWTPQLLELKARVERECKESFNSCLLNLYHSGNEGMTWHCDAEKEMKKNGPIASLSLGAERKFRFKHKASGITKSLFLPHGSLLVMKGETQSHWLHQLPTTKTVNSPRINLTFRKYIE